jgi:26S proteasome regulatory subunit N9
MALEFMQNIANKSFLSEEARLVAKMCICDYLIALGREAEVKKLLDEVSSRLAILEGSGAETAVKSSFYRAESNYYKRVGPAGAFHTSVMQFLAHTPFNTLPRHKRLVMALDVVMAALVADDVFNFGDVLRYEVVQELGTSPAHKWLLDMLVIFNEGDVRGFNNLIDANRKAFESSPTLVANVETLKQKVALLCLVRVVFDRPPHERDVAFKDIASAALLGVDQVEWLVMRAFSKKLLKGTMDEIEQVVHVTWLMPRVLDTVQTKTLDEKLVAWAKSVDHALLLELQNPELFVSH